MFQGTTNQTVKLAHISNEYLAEKEKENLN